MVKQTIANATAICSAGAFKFPSSQSIKQSQQQVDLKRFKGKINWETARKEHGEVEDPDIRRLLIKVDRMEGIGKYTTTAFKNKQIMARTLAAKIEQSASYIETFQHLMKIPTF